jgi:tetratricopeptide (TPR) repeat protein
LDRGNSESKPLYLAPQTVTVKPAQPATPAVAGQHEESKFFRGSDEVAKDVVKQKQAVAEPSALAEALEQYRIIEWDRAGNLLRKSLEKGLLSTSEKFNACVLLGAMAYQLGQIDQADTYFTKAHVMDPSATPSSELFPPQVIEFYKYVNRTIGE